MQDRLAKPKGQLGLESMHLQLGRAQCLDEPNDRSGAPRFKRTPNASAFACSTPRNSATAACEEPERLDGVAIVCTLLDVEAELEAGVGRCQLALRNLSEVRY